MYGRLPFLKKFRKMRSAPTPFGAGAIMKKFIFAC